MKETIVTGGLHFNTLFSPIHLESIIELFNGLNPRLQFLNEVEIFITLVRVFVENGVHTCLNVGVEGHYPDESQCV